MEMEQTVYSETSAHTIQTPANHPKESIQISGYLMSAFTRTD